MKDKEFVVEKIRSQYTEQEHMELDALKALDATAKKPAIVFGYTCGGIGAVILGTGMSLCMTELGSVLGGLSMVLGVLIGIAGMVLVALAYPVYWHTLRKERNRIAPEVLRLTEELRRH